MNHTLRDVFLVFILFSALGCDSVSQYSGDGRLTDNGPFAAIDRYILNLGEISLKQPISKTFNLQNLPKENFVIGIEIQTSSPVLIDQTAITPEVSLSLLEDGKSLFTKVAKLSNWTWSIHSSGNYAFVYSRELPSTFFNPVLGKRYELIFKVIEPDTGTTNYTASLVAKSGGWK